MISIYNTLTKTKERLIPRQSNKIQLFVCGPTVYDYIHIGNARTFVFFDVVAKYLETQGYKVDYIQNITDIDDKIINKAKENKKDPLDWAKEYRQKFEEDMKALGIDSPKYIPATEHIEQVVKQVNTLIQKGFAYEIKNDGWYFDLAKFNDYGKLSGRKALAENDAVSRIDENPNKINAGDFCLWKFSKDAEPSWDTNIGKGRPGWHIEDTAITEYFFGPQYDIHGGGQDLIFPHHEAEIAQQESASDKKPFVKYWMHVAFLINREQKMSKSLGNFTTTHELLSKYSKESLRFYILSGHYRKPLEYNDKSLNQSLAGSQRLREFVTKLEIVNGPDSADIDGLVTHTRQNFNDAMDDDFNTPSAIGCIFELLNNINPLITKKLVSSKNAGQVLDLLKEINLTLGIIPDSETVIPQNVKKLIDQRESFRLDKNYEESDKLRVEISGLGWEIEDTIYGPIAIKK